MIRLALVHRSETLPSSAGRSRAWSASPVGHVLRVVWLVACGGSEELGKPNDPPEWPMGSALGTHPPPPALTPVEMEAAPVTAGPDVSAPQPPPVTEPQAPQPEEPAVEEPPEAE